MTYTSDDFILKGTRLNIILKLSQGDIIPDLLVVKSKNEYEELLMQRKFYRNMNIIYFRVHVFLATLKFSQNC